jgi:lipid II:glycine glycyltransferase (peptidoglycan interpeptide bridge formation enzyme)
MADTVNAKGSMPLRSYEYYAQFWDEFCNRGQGRFFFAYEDGKPSVGAFVINYGAKATYKDGGSTQNRKQYGDSHLVQWAAIRRMQELGCTEYDFCGTPPAAQIKDKAHNLYGMGMFKTSFTKTVTDFVGCHDYVLAPVRHALWVKGAERIFRRLETARTGQQFY